MSHDEVSNQAYGLPFSSIGQDVFVYSYARIVGAEFIAVGDNVIIDDFVLISAKRPSRLGSFVHIASGATLAGSGEIVIDDFAGISSGVRLYSSNDDYLGGSLTGPTIPPDLRGTVDSFVFVGRHAVVGANSVILPGVQIGEGATVGALSLVRDSLEPWTVYAGIPAKRIGERPRDRILALEAELREMCFRDGRYVPQAEW